MTESSSRVTTSLTSLTPTQSFVVMVTGRVEAARLPPSVDNVYCRYTFVFGSDWEIIHGNESGITQLSIKAAGDSNQTITWNFPVDVVFRSKNAHGWPRLVLAVYAIDAFGRDSVQGYASTQCPITSCSAVRYVATYKPLSGTPWTRFLHWLGGTPPEFYDSKFVSQGEGRGVTRVHSEGTVKLILNTTIRGMLTCGFHCHDK